MLFHRPSHEKLRGSEQHIKNESKKAIRQAIADGFTVFINGMARGVDLWAASLVLELREEDRRIKRICASPYGGSEKRWPKEWQTLYASVIEQADHVQFIGKVILRIYSGEETSGWWTILHGSSRSTTERLEGRGTRYGMPNRLVSSAR